MLNARGHERYCTEPGELDEFSILLVILFYVWIVCTFLRLRLNNMLGNRHGCQPDENRSHRNSRTAEEL